MKLYNFFRSGTSHRLRIALNLKGLQTEYIPVDLRTEQHQQDTYKALNPQGLVPALALPGTDGQPGRVLIQSPAIIEWLEERHPKPALLPTDPEDRAHVRALAALVGCDIHPINNRRILEYLRHQHGCDDVAVDTWCAHWISVGFEAYEALLAADKRRGRFSFGDTPTVADVYLVPQAESARRFKVDLTPFPNICAVDSACAELTAFQKAVPSQQPDTSYRQCKKH
jgi:maleylpyruvate isomerase